MSRAGGVRFGFDVDDPRLARVAWGRLTEPADDPEAAVLVAHTGPSEALRLLGDDARLAAALQEPTAGGAPAPPHGPMAGGGTSTRKSRSWLARLGARLRRLDRDLDPGEDLRRARLVGLRHLAPGDSEWPTGLDDLAVPPFGLWATGGGDLADLCRRSVAVVGSRAATSYGEHVAAELAAGLAERGVSVVSGLAFGIDAAAHRGALAAGGASVGALACGADRIYPQGTATVRERLLLDGVVVSEALPGSAAHARRFLARNRLIAAMTGLTVVVEAALRSGALNTARHATDLGRTVAAVPGPVTSMASAGCHQWVRERKAELVTDAAECLELLAASGEDLAPRRSGPGRAADTLDRVERAVLDALPISRSAPPEKVAAVAGLGVRETQVGLGQLALLGLARRDSSGWRRVRSSAEEGSPGP